MGLKHIGHVSEHIRLDIIVGIHKTNILATGDFHPCIARRTETTITFVNNFYAHILVRPSVRNCGRGVGRAIIHDDDFEIAMRLDRKALQASVKISLCVVRRHDNRHQRLGLRIRRLRINAISNNMFRSPVNRGRHERLPVGFQQAKQIAVFAQPSSTEHEIRNAWQPSGMDSANDIRLLANRRIHQRFQSIFIDVPISDPYDCNIFLGCLFRQVFRKAANVCNFNILYRKSRYVPLKIFPALNIAVGNHDQRNSRQGVGDNGVFAVLPGVTHCLSSPQKGIPSRLLSQTRRYCTIYPCAEQSKTLRYATPRIEDARRGGKTMV